jgi:hypothetical protein
VLNNLISEQEEDFEFLNDTSMQWNAKIWSDQVEEGRFVGRIDFNHEYIYWFNSYAAVFAAKSILKDFQKDYSVLVDEATGDFAITTNYATHGWRN